MKSTDGGFGTALSLRAANGADLGFAIVVAVDFERQRAPQ
jgi:hypothetical protein